MANAKLLDFQNIFSLKGKIAVVTGGSRGLGLAAASGILQSGASKVFIVARSSQGCEDACAELNNLPNKQPDAQAIPVPADLATAEGTKQLAKTVSEYTDHISILLANHGWAHRAPFDEFPEEEFSTVLDLNVKSVFYTIQSFTPLLTKKATREDSSRVIVTGSVAGVGLASIGENGNFPYAAAKAGVIHLVKQLAVELGPRHILTNSIAPGFFPTELAAPAIKDMGGEEALSKTYPNGRLGRGEDMAGTVVFLASRAGAHVNGHCIVVDGGGVIGKIKP